MAARTYILDLSTLHPCLNGWHLWSDGLNYDNRFYTWQRILGIEWQDYLLREIERDMRKPKPRPIPDPRSMLDTLEAVQTQFATLQSQLNAQLDAIQPITPNALRNVG